MKLNIYINHVFFLGRVLAGIDATKLETHRDHLRPPFDVVIFNFPHVGGKMRLERNRDLLSNFFASARQVLECRVDEPDRDLKIFVSLCGGQGGTEFDEPKREWENSWQLPLIAARNQLVLSEVSTFIF